MTTSAEDKKLGRILVIDDNLNEVKALMISLGMEGFEVDGAADGEEALEKLRTHSYDMALIDLMMPNINGIQMARKIRAEFPTVATILMSAFNISPFQLAKADLGVVGFVTKPFHFDKLLGLIKTKLQDREGKLEIVSSVSYAF